MKKTFIAVMSLLFFLSGATSAWAHVTVKPKEAAVGAFQTFTVGVPVEKDVPTTEIRLVVPEGLNYVTPNVKPGWTIDIVKDGEGEEAKVKEIRWTGGSIPAGQRDEFLFSAQVPAKEATVAWKAYQTYEDGSVVSWDQDPKKEHGHEDEDETKGPFSETNVVNDIAGSTMAEPDLRKAQSVPITVSVIALALSAAALTLQLRKKK